MSSKHLPTILIRPWRDIICAGYRKQLIRPCCSIWRRELQTKRIGNYRDMSTSSSSIRHPYTNMLNSSDRKRRVTKCRERRWTRDDVGWLFIALAAATEMARLRTVDDRLTRQPVDVMCVLCSWTAFQRANLLTASQLADESIRRIVKRAWKSDNRFVS